MNLTRMTAQELPELERLYEALSMRIPRENLDQFSLPREALAGVAVVTLLMREAGCVIGTVGWIDVPLRVNDARGLPRGAESAPATLRWPINLYLLPEHRGRGLGKQLMESTREGATLRAVIGGNEASIPVLDRTGWRVVGHVTCARWLRPNVSLPRLSDRFSQGDALAPPDEVATRTPQGRAIAHRVDRLEGWLPWAAPEARGEPFEAGAPRTGEYLSFAYGGALRRYYTLHRVTVGGALVGFFALASRFGGRPWLAAEIVDLDAQCGREIAVIATARATALACADVARIRICGGRFTRALAVLTRKRDLTIDHPVRIFSEPGSVDGAHLREADSWRLTYGDHDQYRARTTSRAWRRPERSSRKPASREPAPSVRAQDGSVSGADRTRSEP